MKICFQYVSKSGTKSFSWRSLANQDFAGISASRVSIVLLEPTLRAACQ